MTGSFVDTAGRPLLAPPNIETAAAPCGCALIRVLGRCVLAVPCDRHLGRVEVKMESLPENEPERRTPSEWGVSGNVIIPRNVRA